MDLEKTALICGYTGLFALVILFILCLVCRCCLLNKTVDVRQSIRDRPSNCYARNSFELSSLDVEELPTTIGITKSVSLLSLKSSTEFQNKLTSVNSVSSSICSDIDSRTGIPLPSTSDVKILESETTDELSNAGNVSFTLHLKNILCENGKKAHHLQINLKEAFDLPTRSYGGKCNPYFIISLYEVKVLKKKKRGRADALPILQFRSTEVKKSVNPVYNSSFLFPMENYNIMKCVFVIEAWDKENLVNDTLLGDAHYYLKKNAPACLREPSKEIDICLKLQETKYSNGQLLLGLCYLPIAEQITVAVFKVKNPRRLKETNEGAAYYVQGMAIYDGKISQKWNTSCQPASSKSLVFQEILIFDVPFSKLDNMVLLFAVHCTVENNLDGRENLKVKGGNTCIGKVVIGASSRKSSLDHWNAIRNSPRQQVLQWHELR